MPDPAVRCRSHTQRCRWGSSTPPRPISTPVSRPSGPAPRTDGRTPWKPPGTADSRTVPWTRSPPAPRPVLVHSDCNPVAYLICAEDGEVVCGLEQDAPEDRIGTDPDRLLPHVITAGLLAPDGTRPDDDAPHGCELRMAETVFGLDLPHHDVVHGPLLATGLREGLHLARRLVGRGVERGRARAGRVDRGPQRTDSSAGNRLPGGLRSRRGPRTGTDRPHPQP
ncbi:DUF6461 domain-containing protein [Embleya sp. NPDC056575]|uniref:DUF6461 domain-containing protein n=1 Tax=unclassified Embleya TaxID=2699296 RepID=UPI00369C4B2B